MAGLNVKAAGMLSDISHGFGLVQAAKKNDIGSQKELNECAALNNALHEKLMERWGRSWQTALGKADEQPVTPAPDAERDAIIAELKELKVGFHPNTGTPKLKEILANIKKSAAPEQPVTPAPDADIELANMDVPQLLDFAQANDITLPVPVPTDKEPLMQAIVDALDAKKIDGAE